MLAGSKEESPTAAWVKAKRKCMAGCCHPGLQSSHFWQHQQGEELVSQLWKAVSLPSGNISASSPCCSTEIGFRETSQCLTVSNILLRYFCILWITGAVIFTWALNHLETEGEKPSKVPAAFYPVSARKVFRGNWRYEKSSSHYWQCKPLRHFRCFIAFN